MRKMLIASVALLALTGAACGSDGDGGSTGGDSTGGGPTGADTGCTADNAVDLTLFDPFIVTIQDLAFQPDCFDAKSASSIRVENKDTVTHTFTIDGTQVDVSIDGGQTFNGGSAGLEPGSYDFRCTIHSAMTGTVIVS
jgi:plastocyanin